MANEFNQLSTQVPSFVTYILPYAICTRGRFVTKFMGLALTCIIVVWYKSSPTIRREEGGRRTFCGGSAHSNNLKYFPENEFGKAQH